MSIEPLAMPTDRRGRVLPIAWLALGVSALALAGLFAILLVLARTPGFEGWFPTQDFFRTALVVHVDQSVLIWFLAFAGAIWSLDARHQGFEALLRWLALLAAGSGCLLVAAAPFFGAGNPLMNNYVPVLRHPLFIIALAIFGAGMLLQVMLVVVRGAVALNSQQPLRVGAYTAALAAGLSAASLLWSAYSLSADWQGEAYYEYLFWGSGHVLQFAYTQLMLVAWLWLAGVAGVTLAASSRWLSALLVLGVLPLLLVPLIHAGYAVDSGFSRLAFTRLMQYGNAVAAVPIGLLLLIGLLRRAGAPLPADAIAPYRALLASLLLFAAGGALGTWIGGVNTVIPAHYHGSIVGVTLALMGLTYVLLPRLGFAAPCGRMARLQPWLYGAGQLLHIGGLAWSGAMGIQRKTAGAAQGLEGLSAKLAMAVMGIGGLLAVLGGILFVLVVIRAFTARTR